MTQSTMLNGAVSNQRLMELPQRALSRGSQKSEESFMDVLSERMQARNDASKPRTGLTDRSKPLSFAKDNRPVSQEKVKASSEAANTEDVHKANPAEAKETTKAQETDTPKVENSDENSKKDSKETTKEDTIKTLESIVAMLQDLAASLNALNASGNAQDTQAASSETQLVGAADSASAAQQPSPAELLKALLEGNTDKLKDLMGKLQDAPQTPEFKNLLENLQTLVDKLDNSKNQDALKALVNLKVTVENGDAGQQDLMLKLKAQCQDVIDKLNLKISELKAGGDTVQGQDNQAGQMDISPVDGAQNAAKAAVNPDKPEAKTEIKLQETKEKPGTGDIKPEALQSKDTQQLDPISDNSRSMSVQDGQKPLDNTVQVKADKASMPLPEKPMAQAVTNQVTMKVKLMAGENKQEMEMNLKPESLGKLSLKIIHERGEVLAKITAENEQVKGILESNMQLLKDSLEKSGLSVQSLSVSVGNGQEKNQAQQGQADGNRARNNGMGQTVKVGGLSETLFNRSRTLNPYENDTQIDLTA